ncbi:hypothetical protein [Jannaschia rubra]|uniref:Uncharacterized protein n=1 Tax=Jannaschia rubra TaxID=282197 RepID=A0A0M6XPK0_9RHOB|nr:hypothetical protein [Jannaschia rubra]CTQ33086.1 hypothetical protein JAN5088_01862 [Jannaschia rubra]SFG74402.1 hypothetical protein SAMN04488517_11339 [Jannaschia rubra]
MDYLQTSYEDWGSNSSQTAWSDAGGIAAVPGSPSCLTELVPWLSSRCYFKLSDGFDAGGLQRALVAIPEIGHKFPI